MSTISVCVGSYGWYNEGELRDTWLDLPVDPSTIKPWLIEHRLWDRRHEEIYISDYDGVPLGCSYGGAFSECTMLEHLNMLAQLMDMLPLEVEKVEAFIKTCGDEPESVLGLCAWILQADDLPYFDYDVPDYCRDDSPEEKYGLQLARYTKWYEQLEANGVSDYFSLEDYGRAWSANVCLGDEGYVDQCCDYPDEDRYSWDDIEQMMPWHTDEE